LLPKATEKGLAVIYAEDFSYLIIHFSIGYALIWLLIYVMYHRATIFRSQLDLSSYKIKFTQKEKRGALLDTLIGLAAIVMSLAGWVSVAGICYLLIPPVLILNEKLCKKSLQNGKKGNKHSLLLNQV